MKKILSALALAAVSAAAIFVPTTAATAASGSGYLHTDGSTIRKADNSEYTIKAVSWFGMETDICAPHGLWTMSIDAGLDNIAGMGFNTIRLPYSNQCLTSSPKDVNYYQNPDLQGKTSLQVMDTFIDKAEAKGLNVILDRHRPSSSSQSELWYTSEYSEAKWIADWKMLANRYKSEPTVIGADLHNEPAGAATWGGSAATDWHAAATRAGNAVLATNPNWLIIVEGVESYNGDYTWWGGNLQGVATKPVSLTTPNRVVYSPHEYPQSVYNQKWFSDPAYPANMTAIWDKNFGYIAKKGIAPVLVGEFGTRLETDSDKKWMASFVDYMKVNKMSFSYWSFNPNSSDTGGIVKTDWKTREQAKLDAMAPILTKSLAPTPTPTPTKPPTQTPVPTPTPTPTKPPVTATPTPTPTPTPTKPPVTATPTPAPTPTPTNPPVTTTPTPAPTTSAAKATWSLQSKWGTGYVANVKVDATKPVNSWTVTWKDAKATKVVNSWGMKCSIAAGTVTCTGSDWSTKVAAGQSIQAGVQLDSTTAPTNPVITFKTT